MLFSGARKEKKKKELGEGRFANPISRLGGAPLGRAGSNEGLWQEKRKGPEGETARSRK